MWLKFGKFGEIEHFAHPKTNLVSYLLKAKFVKLHAAKLIAMRFRQTFIVYGISFIFAANVPP